MKPQNQTDTQQRLFEFKAPAGTTRLSATYWAMPTKPRLVGSTERTTAEELPETLVSVWLGTSGRCLKSQLTVSPATEECIKVAESVMFSALKIEQKFPQKHAITDD